MEFIKSKLDSPNAWIGAIGLILFFLGLHTFLFVLFILLIVLPEANFSDWFSKGAAKIRDLDKQ